MLDWIKRWGPAIFFMTAIFLFSSIPDREMPNFGGWDYLTKKGSHMLGYALLACTYYYAIYRSKIPARRRFLLAVCLASLYAASDEWHQSFVPGRNCSLVDVGFDTLGGIIGVALFRLARKSRFAQKAEANASAD
jgi:VanZ family protein